jgi:hypothetical protein
MQLGPIFIPKFYLLALFTFLIALILFFIPDRDTDDFEVVPGPKNQTLID